MSIVNRTGVVVPVEMARFAFEPLKSGPALYIHNSGDLAGPVNFSWNIKYTCFFKAIIFSTPLSAARLIAGSNGNTHILLTATGIQVSHQGSTATTGAILEYNVLHDYAIVYDGRFVRCYRDMAPFVAAKLTTAPTTAALNYTLFNRSDGLRQCDMNIARFQWYNRAFSPQEIVAPYPSNPNDLKDLELRYDFKEGSGATLIDTSGKGRNVTISGSSWTTFDIKRPITTYGDQAILSARPLV